MIRIHTPYGLGHPLNRRRPNTIGTVGAVVTLVAALVAGSALPASAETAAPVGHRGTLISDLRADLSQYLAARGTPEHISALGLTITFAGHDDDRNISLGAGTTTYGGDTPVSPRALWQIGSNTKAFTSVMVLQLEAQRKLSINDTLGTWLPQYPAWSHVTIRQLLDMTSGIPDYTSQPAFAKALIADPNTIFSTAQLVSYAYGPPLGSGYAYSNTNYVLLQMIIERVTHDSYGDQLTRRILIPLGLRDTCYAPYTCPPSFARRMPTGYFFFPGVPTLQGYPVPPLNLTFAQGAGAIVSSLPDMATWDRALYSGRMLPPKQQRELESLVSTTTGLPISTTTPSDPEGYGLGVVQITSPIIGTAWFYEGETYGFRVLHMYLPDSGTLIALAANSAVGQADQLGSLLVAVYQTLHSDGAIPAHESGAGPGLGLPLSPGSIPSPSGLPEMS